ncbi:hypothetical protein N2601_08730 [Rhizobium sp. CB3060]|uniref:hypothetical protein n=1 Tax=Rhizobium sp. CB3060 TaxID=3138255 RepID=UPI0021A7F72F|nr:hypothetical protein [Rhizobium tropici]UWU23014.1 hypothetical protein N2601_08730 [Rhizobium tropici]
MVTRRFACNPQPPDSQAHTVYSFGNRIADGIELQLKRLEMKMTNFFFAIVDADGNYLERGLEYRQAAERLLRLDDNSFRFESQPDGLIELQWGKWGQERPTGIQGGTESDIFWQVISRDEPWCGRQAFMEQFGDESWWRIAQPGRPPFYGYGSAAEAYAYCNYLNQGHRSCEKKRLAFQVHHPDSRDVFEGGYRSGSGNVKLADALREFRSVFAIDRLLPVVLRDLHYPDRLFELTSKIFVRLKLRTENGLVSGSAHLRVHIGETYIGWDEEDWRAVIESALRRTEDTDLGWHFDLANPATAIEVSLGTTWGQDILLYRRKSGAVQDIPAIDLNRLRGEIYHKIASVPDSGRTDICRQAALSADGKVEIKCKRRGLHLLSRRDSSQH